jgi:murein DD-endopeptidase MepM/ murein hydrolase activator NlpD
MSVHPILAALVVVPLLISPPPSAADFLSRERISAAESVQSVGVRPVAGPVTKRFDPPATKYAAGHRGVDLRARAGEPVVAALGGTVTFAGRVAGVSWVTVGHGGGLSTTYGPIEPRLVGSGDVVGAGEVIGFLAQGSRHLDWGARFEGQYVDPLSLLGRWEIYLTGRDDVVGLPALGGPAAASAHAALARRGRMLVPASGPMTSSYGMRVHPVTGAHRLHAGLDIGAGYGQPIRAAAAGMVSYAGDVSGYGSTVMVDHGGGVTTLYAHQSRVAVAAGQRVAAGQTLGSVGASGLATGPHLHFEVRVDGAPHDPAGWLR